MSNKDERALALQERAVTIRSYLQSDQVKKQVEMAVARHLDPERLLRVAYTAIVRNPRLIECTTESLLSCIIQCAQLGLEPVLGRAHLVPFKNNKKGGVYEAQFQPGYQGLADLMRRSGQVADLWAEVIYEVDEYEISYGLERSLIHKPKFTEDRGKPVGAYFVVLHKDGTKGWTYMPISEIYSKHRARSQAFKAAEKYKNYDSPWHTDEEAMLKKTAVKVHSKMAPLSIESQVAVAMDDAAEIGAPLDEAWSAFLKTAKGDEFPEADVVIDTETGEIIEEGAEEEVDEEVINRFNELVATDFPDDTSSVEQFVKLCAESGSITPYAVRLGAIGKWEGEKGFSASYALWLKGQKKKEPEKAKDEKPEKAEKPAKKGKSPQCKDPIAQDIVDSFWSLRKPGWVKGYESFCKDYHSWPEEAQKAFRQKCANMSSGDQTYSAPPPPDKPKEPETEPPGGEEPPTTPPPPGDPIGLEEPKAFSGAAAGIFQVDEVMTEHLLPIGYNKEQFEKYALSIGAAIPPDPEKERHSVRFSKEFIDRFLDNAETEIRKFEDWIAS